MSLFINNNSGPVYSECNVTIINGQTTTQQPEDITPEPSSVSPESNSGSSTSEKPDSIIFTKKAKKEAKEAAIIAALQKSVQGRKDKTRAFVEELQEWQNEGYVDAHYNAKVMYDELEKITALTFSYDTFRKYYNNLI